MTTEITTLNLQYPHLDMIKKAREIYKLIQKSDNSGCDKDEHLIAQANKLLQYAYEYKDMEGPLAQESIQLKYDIMASAIYIGANPDNIILSNGSPWLEDLESISKIAIMNNNIALLTPFLLSTVFLPPSSNIEFETDRNNLIEILINNGADINHDYFTDGGTWRLLDAALHHDLITLFKEHGATCSNYFENQYKDEGVYEKLKDIELRREQFFDNIALTPESYAPKMSTTLHQIWLNNLLSPKELSTIDLECILNNHNIFFKEFSHIVWTNNKASMPISVKTLEENGIEVREFTQDIRLYNQITQAISDREFGIASDTLRYVILEQNGGLYADINFAFHNVTDFKSLNIIENKMRTYDFFAPSPLDNVFFAKAHHPILVHLLDSVEKKFELHKNEKNIILKTSAITQTPFIHSYIKLANEGINKDLMLPPSPPGEEEITAGFHELCPSQWLQDELLGFSRIDNLLGEDGYKGSGYSWLDENKTQIDELFDGNNDNIDWGLQIDLLTNLSNICFNDTYIS